MYLQGLESEPYRGEIIRFPELTLHNSIWTTINEKSNFLLHVKRKCPVTLSTSPYTIIWFKGSFPSLYRNKEKHMKGQSSKSSYFGKKQCSHPKHHYFFRKIFVQSRKQSMNLAILTGICGSMQEKT